MISKKADMPWIIIGFILAIVMCLVLISSSMKYNGKFGRSADDVTGTFGDCKVGTLLIPEDKYVKTYVKEYDTKSESDVECDEGDDRIPVGLKGKICCASETDESDFPN